jgi:hypothetical protein
VLFESIATTKRYDIFGLRRALAEGAAFVLVVYGAELLL